MLGIGSTELVIILVFGFLLFGPDKLPQMGRTIVGILPLWTAHGAPHGHLRKLGGIPC